ncbi:hypothetical protein TraAM80_10146 [Trypanosoma rangeli]|uniref:Mucin-associated surface protein (MASP) n=1 Tax=Trypanosoma rangeli TaxID=5698 RepID=A0A422MR64_TRYRA|nr:uncharacterized protein TraAM80_10146 [Trypanosoma rangeli]RNE95681.1 hypothetical protein TraAM80_10146 [Trypanosoma rangeli]|eukprot:RNE95681.1 hypothetical protein TraAM80_10146 [Trypanosoma rangeli]
MAGRVLLVCALCLLCCCGGYTESASHVLESRMDKTEAKLGDFFVYNAIHVKAMKLKGAQIVDVPLASVQAPESGSSGSPSGELGGGGSDGAAGGQGGRASPSVGPPTNQQGASVSSSPSQGAIERGTTRTPAGGASSGGQSNPSSHVGAEESRDVTAPVSQSQGRSASQPGGSHSVASQGTSEGKGGHGRQSGGDDEAEAGNQKEGKHNAPSETKEQGGTREAAHTPVVTVNTPAGGSNEESLPLSASDGVGAASGQAGRPTTGDSSDTQPPVPAVTSGAAFDGAAGAPTNGAKGTTRPPAANTITTGSDSSNAVSHCTSPLVLLLFVLGSAAMVAA